MFIKELEEAMDSWYSLHTPHSHGNLIAGAVDLNRSSAVAQVEVAPIPTPKEGVAGAEHAAAVGEAQ